MNSTPNAKTIEPDGDLIARADEHLAHVNEQVSKLEHDAARNPSAALGRLPSRGRPMLRGLIGLLLAAFIFITAFVSQSSHGDAARLIFARWAPQLILTSSLPMEKPVLPAQPSRSAVQVAAAEPIAAQPTPLAQTAPQDVAPTAAAVSPGVAQLLQTMARDLANVKQRIEQLKTSQEQMATDNAKAVEQLKASQEQMTRLIAKTSDKTSEQNLRPKTSAPPSRPIAYPTRKPVPRLPSPHARAQPQAPVQLQPDE